LDIVPPILPPSGGSLDDVVALTRTMGVAIGNIMQRSIDEGNIKSTRHFIKQLLSAFHRVDGAMLKEGDKPGWLTSYNFLCLLNIPSLMKCYGPISNIWEGGYDGERYSQELKQRLKGGLKENWHKNVLDSVLNDDSMKPIELPESQLESDNSSAEKLFKKYGKCNLLLKDYNNRVPISVLYVGDNLWGAAISKESVLQKVLFNEYKGCINGLHYWVMHICIDEVIPFTNAYATNYCIAFPKLTSNGLPQRNDEPTYCLIESTWMDIVPDINNKPCFVTPIL
jgi:hypothetical protein